MRGGLSWTKLGADRETIPIRISIVTLNNTMAWLASIIQLPGILPQSMFLSLVTQNYYDCHHRSFEIMRFVDLWLWNGAAAAGLITSSWRSVHETGWVEREDNIWIPWWAITMSAKAFAVEVAFKLLSWYDTPQAGKQKNSSRHRVKEPTWMSVHLAI